MRCLILGLLLSWAHAVWEPLPEDGVRIRVARSGWGEADSEDVEKVLESAGASLWRQVSLTGSVTLEVSRTKGDPITLFKRGPSGEIRIKLNAQDLQWSQFAFQFAHEVGHVLCGFADYPNPNLWFEESLCEVASLYALGRMAKAWASHPPYPNWKGYEASLLKYRDDRLARSQLPEGKALSAWFRQEEPSLRRNPTRRDQTRIVASALLALFEEDPTRWDAVRTLNAVPGDASRSFLQYLKDWSRSAAEKHRPFIRALAGRFGVDLLP